ncbi:hypothetical protein P167DRAFT_572353 [Morchella conica CCBAS932]|uniref:Uncharacterized protein n=1 Tax=Morchella conica CCBAS932 TaxID=1392247 RepID=A0A3N4KVN7_9PEZI|nr:hypothetical protein P167DRAFT_572353 [Morchella conica CCBAS932]
MSEYAEEVVVNKNIEVSTSMFWLPPLPYYQDIQDDYIYVQDVGNIKVPDIHEKFSAILTNSVHLVSPIILFVEDDMSSAVGNHTHSIVEFEGSSIRYSLQLYKGISTWFYKKQQLETEATGPPHDPPMIKNEILEKNLIFVGKNTFNFLETISNKSWLATHKNCSEGHFRVNVHLIERGPIYYNVNGCFVTHKVCGGALLSDLFRVLLGKQKGYFTREDPEDDEGWGEAPWEKVEFTEEWLIETVMRNCYYFKCARENRITIKQTGWFEKKDYVWLLPIALDSRRMRPGEGINGALSPPG